MCFILMIGYVFLFPEKFIESPTFLETIEADWGLSLPNSDKELYLMSSRDGFDYIIFELQGKIKNL